MKFVVAFGELMAEAQLPPQLREAWSFSACMSLIIALARLAPGASPATSPSLGATVSDAGCGACAPLLSQAYTSKRCTTSYYGVLSTPDP